MLQLGKGSGGSDKNLKGPSKSPSGSPAQKPKEKPKLPQVFKLLPLNCSLAELHEKIIARFSSARELVRFIRDNLYNVEAAELRVGYLALEHLLLLAIHPKFSKEISSSSELKNQIKTLFNQAVDILADTNTFLGKEYLNSIKENELGDTQRSFHVKRCLDQLENLFVYIQKHVLGVLSVSGSNSLIERDYYLQLCAAKFQLWLAVAEKCRRMKNGMFIRIIGALSDQSLLRLGLWEMLPESDKKLYKKLNKYAERLITAKAQASYLIDMLQWMPAIPDVFLLLRVLLLTVIVKKETTERKKQNPEQDILNLIGDEAKQRYLQAENKVFAQVVTLINFLLRNAVRVQTYYHLEDLKKEITLTWLDAKDEVDKISKSIQDYYREKPAPTSLPSDLLTLNPEKTSMRAPSQQSPYEQLREEVIEDFKRRVALLFPMLQRIQSSLSRIDGEMTDEIMDRLVQEMEKNDVTYIELNHHLIFVLLALGEAEFKIRKDSKEIVEFGEQIPEEELSQRGIIKIKGFKLFDIDEEMLNQAKTLSLNLAKIIIRVKNRAYENDTLDRVVQSEKEKIKRSLKILNSTRTDCEFLIESIKTFTRGGTIFQLVPAKMRMILLEERYGEYCRLLEFIKLRLGKSKQDQILLREIENISHTFAGSIKAVKNLLTDKEFYYLSPTFIGEIYAHHSANQLENLSPSLEDLEKIYAGELEKLKQRDIDFEDFRKVIQNLVDSLDTLLLELPTDDERYYSEMRETFENVEILRKRAQALRENCIKTIEEFNFAKAQKVEASHHRLTKRHSVVNISARASVNSSTREGAIVNVLSDLGISATMDISVCPGDDFFHAVGEWLNEKEHTHCYSEKILRSICWEHYQQNQGQLDAAWRDEELLNGTKVIGKSRYGEIRYTKREMKALYNREHDCISGRYFIEGQMLCAELDELPAIYVVEFSTNPLTKQLQAQYIEIDKTHVASITQDQFIARINNNCPMLVLDRENNRCYPLKATDLTKVAVLSPLLPSEQPMVLSPPVQGSLLAAQLPVQHFALNQTVPTVPKDKGVPEELADLQQLEIMQNRLLPLEEAERKGVKLTEAQQTDLEDLRKTVPAFERKLKQKQEKALSLLTIQRLAREESEGLNGVQVSQVEGEFDPASPEKGKKKMADRESSFSSAPSPKISSRSPDVPPRTTGGGWKPGMHSPSPFYSKPPKAKLVASATFSYLGSGPTSPLRRPASPERSDQRERQYPESPKSSRNLGTGEASWSRPSSHIERPQEHKDKKSSDHDRKKPLSPKHSASRRLEETEATKPEKNASGRLSRSSSHVSSMISPTRHKRSTSTGDATRLLSPKHTVLKPSDATSPAESDGVTQPDQRPNSPSLGMKKSVS